MEKRIQEDNLQHLALFSEYGRMALDKPHEEEGGHEEEEEEEKAVVSLFCVVPSTGPSGIVSV